MPTQAHLYARPAQVTVPAPSGMQTLPLGGKRDSYLYVPPRYDPRQPLPLVLLLHGAGGHAHDGMGILLRLADQAGLILLAPASAGSTWDIIAARAYGADVGLIDQALAHVFERYAIDPSRIAIGGFSDGASYALTLGMANGDLFTHVMAFSPGFIGPMNARGEPELYISHGTEDEILPVNPCSRSIVKQLELIGYKPHYVEFDGGHTIPPEAAQAAIAWFTSGK
jgi:phospholipase/carboxylesterase